MKKIIFYPIALLSVITIFLSACKKEFDSPPVKPVESGSKINIAMLKAKFTASNYRFKNDSNLYCVVIADEVSGNLYKDIYVRDATGALHVKFINSGGYFIGDSIRINLKGSILNNYNNLIQLDSVDSEANIIKLASGYNPQPVAMTIKQVIANTAATNSVQSKLIRLDNVEFVPEDRGQQFADADGKTSMNRVLKSCTGETLTVRTGGYSNFASKTTPHGNGSIIAIASQYGTTMQLLIRNYNDVKMEGALCLSTPTVPGATTYLNKNFDDNNLSSGGWINANITGTISWATSTFSSQTFAKINNYVSSVNNPCETWLISPAIDLSTSTKPALSFQNAYKYNGAPLECYVSTNYTNGLPGTATWTKLSFTLSNGNFAFVSSGNIDLSAYKTNNTHIAFKYTGSNMDGSTWEIDDVVVKEN